MANRKAKNLATGLNPDARYIFAISGGVDSMSLLHLCGKEGLRGKVITVDHSLRADSASDAEFVKREAEILGFPAEIVRVNVKAEMKRTGDSAELAARRLRYEAIFRAVKEENAAGAVFAHHLGDQAETVLMRILRGTGVAGIKGMGERDGVFRPFLRYTAEEIKDYAEENAVPYREDSTNKESVYRRNFLRNEVFPRIAEVYPDYERSFARLAANAAETEDYFKTVLIAPKLDENSARFGLSILSEHPAVWKRSIRAALLSLGVDKDVESRNYDAIFALKNKTRAAVDLGQGFVARAEYGELILEKAIEIPAFCEEFRINGVYEHAGKRYAFRRGEKIKKGVTIAAKALETDGLVVRTRRDGDVFKRYKGGRKSLSDYLTDIKMPQKERSELLVLAKDSEIYAVLGVEIADAVKSDGGEIVEVVVTEI